LSSKSDAEKPVPLGKVVEDKEIISPSSTCSAETGADVPIPTLPEDDKIVSLSLPPAQNLNLSESKIF